MLVVHAEMQALREDTNNLLATRAPVICRLDRNVVLRKIKTSAIQGTTYLLHRLARRAVRINSMAEVLCTRLPVTKRALLERFDSRRKAMYISREALLKHSTPKAAMPHPAQTASDHPPSCIQVGLNCGDRPSWAVLMGHP
uniref:Uncharacterized protein n=1 Tax=Coccolithus braarudii TaxID=221442 RepID=A0A6T7G5Y1_9EUKA